MDESEEAANSLVKAVTKNDGASKRFISMIQGYKEQADGSVHMALPFKGEELVEYIDFLGKGQYFKKKKVPFNPGTHIFNIRFANKLFIQSFQDSYKDSHGTNCFRDLEKNNYSEIINGGECIIYSKNRGYMFVFHDYTVITIKVMRKNKKNIFLCSEKTEELINDFNEHT